jgi:hypothetical protein
VPREIYEAGSGRGAGYEAFLNTTWRHGKYAV